jgi:hypothetical protein
LDIAQLGWEMVPTPVSHHKPEILINPPTILWQEVIEALARVGYSKQHIDTELSSFFTIFTGI